MWHDTDWCQADDDEDSAWVRFLAALDLSPSELVALLRARFRIAEKAEGLAAYLIKTCGGSK